MLHTHAQLSDRLLGAKGRISTQGLRRRFHRFLITWRKRPQRVLYPITQLAYKLMRYKLI